MTNILVTGGLGYIGSHTVIKLLEDGHNIIILDNLSNSDKNVLDIISDLAGLDIEDKSRLNFEFGDIRIKDDIDKVFNKYNKKNLKIKAVIHFAGVKSVNESILYPNYYWEVNLNGTINLLEIMCKFNCKQIIFSSSCTIYGDSHQESIKEIDLRNPCNPYGFTKLAVEMYLHSISKCNDFNIPQKKTNDDWRIGILRYFNPLGAHESGLIGENPKGIPNNIFPSITKVAINELEKIIIFGKDYPTRDGTPIRDYIHVMDIANGHVATFNYLTQNEPQLLTLNLGTGLGTSVLELITTFNKVNKMNVKYEFGNRRQGDAVKAVANTSLSKSILGWKAKMNINDMCIDGWKWQQNLHNKNQANLL